MKLTDAEWKVMDVLWRRAPARARDVLEELAGETDWAYTTAKTVLVRLQEKGAVREQLRGNVAWYEPRVTRTKARRSAFAALLERAFGGSVDPLLEHLVREERLSARERTKLRALLEGDAAGGARALRKRPPRAGGGDAR